jgi:inorganic phosphate transporter, PiT family
MSHYSFLAEVNIPPMSFTTGFFLFLAVGMALAFEFVNGFHDTANACATVIYTHSLKDKVAVVWSGLCNLLGVLMSSGAVAFGIIALLPVELVLNVGSAAGFAMVFSLLLSAILWNVGTWYLGLPASSSHTLIGAIMGVGIGNAIMNGRPISAGINWTKVTEVGTSLLVSPLVGFMSAAALLLLAKALIKKPELYRAPEKDKAPPLWIRSILIGTCTGVSYFHGSNDGQKGMGLIMLILVGIVPSSFALKMDADAELLKKMSGASHALVQSFDQHAKGVTVTEKEATTELYAFIKASGKLSDKTFPALAEKNRENAAALDKVKTLTAQERRDLRENFYLTASAIDKLVKAKQFPDEAEAKAAKEMKKSLDGVTKYIPDWVKVAIALALGLGTMVGYKRIVITVGEKIGKAHLTYAQGAAAELVAMSTIAAADVFGLPVSTTHVLSSGIAGTMAANKSGLQGKTLRNILLAWVLTLPACIFLGALLFSIGLTFVFKVLGLK